MFERLRNKKKIRGWYADFTHDRVVPVFSKPHMDNGYEMRELEDGTAVLEVSIARTREEAYVRLVESIKNQAVDMQKSLDKLKARLKRIEQSGKQDGIF
jgi:tRNA uridine 5-carbamoylmethylation protein Kti12